MTKDDAEYVVDTITALRAEVKKLTEERDAYYWSDRTHKLSESKYLDKIVELRSENEKLREALENVLSWAEGVAGDTMDMEAREIEIASVERALAVLGKNHE